MPLIRYGGPSLWRTLAMAGHFSLWRPFAMAGRYRRNMTIYYRYCALMLSNNVR